MVSHDSEDDDYPPSQCMINFLEGANLPLLRKELYLARQFQVLRSFTAGLHEQGRWGADDELALAYWAEALPHESLSQCMISSC